MKPTTYSAIKAIIDGDETIPSDERTMILDACRSPAPRRASSPTAVLSRVEAAERLRVSVKTVDRLIRSGQLRSSRFGHCRRIASSAVEELAGKDPTADLSRSEMKRAG